MPKRTKLVALQGKERKRKRLDEQLNVDWDILEGKEGTLEDAPRSFKDSARDESLPVIVDGHVQRKYKKSKAVAPTEASDASESEVEKESMQNGQAYEEKSLPELKEMIATYAERINEFPAENTDLLVSLQNIASRSGKVRSRQLILLSLMKMYRTLIPGYRIRSLTDVQMKEKVGKDVRKTRDFEQSLLRAYKSYVDLLRTCYEQGRLAEEGRKHALATTSVIIACDLLKSVAYFNFRGELISIIIRKLSQQRIDQGFNVCIDCLSHIFQSDHEGHVSSELVNSLAKMIKQRHYKVDSRVVAVLTQLRLLTELTGRADLERMRKAKPTEVIKKKDRIALSKKQRKERREQKEIDEEMRKAELVVSAEMREKLQAQTLKQVLVLYFMILKNRSKSLTPATLEGLARFSHLINVELFGDLLEVLRQIITEQNGHSRQTLLCIMTAFSLVEKQKGESMQLDLSFFINELYAQIYAMTEDPTIDFSHKHLESAHKGKLTSETDMLVQSLTSLFSKAAMSTRPRVLAFTKRLALCSLHYPDRTTSVCINVMNLMIRKHPYVKSLYSTRDRISRGTYDPESELPEHSNAEVSTIWETALLVNHYNPKISAAAKKLSQTRDD